MSRAKATILLIHSEFLARADFSSGATPSLQFLKRQARPAEMSLPDLVKVALNLGPGCGRSVWILCEDLWTQMLAFPVATVAGLDDTQLTRAFAFEAEPLSEIAGTDAALAYAPTDITQDMRSFWISATDIPTRNQMQAVVRQAGGRLAGLLHPGGVPTPLGKVERNQAWSRIELWEKTTVCLSGHGHARGRAQVFNAGSAQPRVQAGITSWVSGTDPKHVELLEADTHAASLGLPAARALNLSDEKQLGEWLTAWMGVLSAESIQNPVIAPAPLATPKYLFALVGIVAELLVVAACFGHWSYVNREKKTVLDELNQRRQLTQQATDLKKKSGEVKGELDKLITVNDATDKSRKQLMQEFAQQRERVERLLANLSAKRPADVVIQSITADDVNVLKIKGLALESSLSDQLALSLSESLKNTGWTVQPFEKESGKELSNGGPWTFSLAVRDPSSNTMTSGIPEPTTTRHH